MWNFKEKLRAEKAVLFVLHLALLNVNDLLTLLKLKKGGGGGGRGGLLQDLVKHLLV